MDYKLVLISDEKKEDIAQMPIGEKAGQVMKLTIDLLDTAFERSYHYAGWQMRILRRRDG